MSGVDKVKLPCDKIQDSLKGRDKKTFSVGFAQQVKAPEELLRAVKEDIDRFVGEAPQFDDITMLCVEYREAMQEEKTA